jgi:hypothetical protein
MISSVVHAGICSNARTVCTTAALPLAPASVVTQRILPLLSITINAVVQHLNVT